MSYVYLDNAATTPLCAEAIAAMAPYMDVEGEHFGNANSLYTIGRNAFAELESARETVTRALHASRPDEIVFTSGATESDNAALVGLSLAQMEKRRLKGKLNPGRIVVSRLEHHAVLHVEPMLKALGFAVDFVGNDETGLVTPADLEAVLCEDTVLVSIMMANNEVGIVEPVAELAQVAHKAGALFHTDATQAVGKVPIDLKGMGVDAASFSAHKINGPKGVGVLYLKAGTPFMSYLVGGGQERGMRSGTQNVMGAAGAAAAFKRAAENVGVYQTRVAQLRDYAYERLCKLPGVSRMVEASAENPDGYLPNIVCVSVRGWESESLILRMDLAGYCVSGGSACSSNSLDPSHVLAAMGVDRKRALGMLRLSLSLETTQEDIDGAVEALGTIISK
ncbi:cysteine desulfurase family protein [Slackia heliotrinireducens]|jgi:cysteine desulfurase|uniref:cysteine desulfurase family protein n=1 Tax=Slackia heliotrinireducens TaxID=84110 RepID=UPI003314834E